FLENTMALSTSTPGHTASASKPGMLPEHLKKSLDAAQAQVNGLVLGKAHEVRLSFVALLANGHLLIEDLPGLGKTTLAHALAATLGLDFQRVQFTSDLLPADRSEERRVGKECGAGWSPQRQESSDTGA